jgi:hypothetical protein
MSVRIVGTGSSRNGIPERTDYVYRGCGVDVLEDRPPRSPAARQEGHPGLPERVLAALRSLGGDASTPEIRAAVDRDGGPVFSPNYLIQVLGRLSRRDPPAVTHGERERTGRGFAARWQLGPGADMAGGGG